MCIDQESEYQYHRCGLWIKVGIHVRMNGSIYVCPDTTLIQLQLHIKMKGEHCTRRRKSECKCGRKIVVPTRPSRTKIVVRKINVPTALLFMLSSNHKLFRSLYPVPSSVRTNQTLDAVAVAHTKREEANHESEQYANNNGIHNDVPPPCPRHSDSW